jgi:putative ABC transport system substrate-binding protein
VRTKLFKFSKLIWVLLSISASPHFFSVAQADEGSIEVCVTQIVEHPALDSTRQGIWDEIKSQKPDTLIAYENAQASIPAAIQIGQKFLSMKPKVIVAISTPSVQAVLRGSEEVPVVFAAVSNPDAAGLTHDEMRAFVTGTTDLPPADEQLIFVQSLLPHVKKIGVIYNTGEANSVSFVDQLKQECVRANLELVESSVVKSSDVTAAVAKVISSGVDCILLSQDNTVVSALDAVLKVANAVRVPIIASDTDLISRGIFAAMGYSRYEAGRETGKIVMDVLRGVLPKDIPIRPAGTLKKLINVNVKDALGIDVDGTILKQHELFKE